MSKVFVMGDIHGAYRALIQCLERSDFDYDNDHLICLGDVCDGWPETKRCIDELLRITHLSYILGNHDTWTLEWMKTGYIENIWYVQGGEATIDSYQAREVPASHIALLERALPYLILEDRLFVHAGIDVGVPIELQDNDTFLWDRTLARTALQDHRSGARRTLTRFSEVYVGHTPIPFPEPIFASGVWLMDTGAGWQGVLSMRDINSGEIITSDSVPSLYPGVAGRGMR